MLLFQSHLFNTSEHSKLGVTTCMYSFCIMKTSLQILIMNACIETRFHYIEFKQNQYPLFSKFFKSDNQWLLFFLRFILLIKDNCNNGSNSTEKEKHKINKSYNINLIPIPCFYSLFSCFFTTTNNTS